MIIIVTVKPAVFFRILYPLIFPDMLLPLRFVTQVFSQFFNGDLYFFSTRIMLTRM